MGLQNNSLSIDSKLLEAITNSLSVWHTGFPSPVCQNAECNLENEIRCYLSNSSYVLQLNCSSIKKCCFTTKGPLRYNSTTLPYNYEVCYSGRWVPATFHPHLTQLSPDIYCKNGSKTIVAEIKFLWKKYFPYLTGNENSLTYNFDTPYNVNCGTGSHLNISCPIDQSINAYSDLGDGKIWMDILRLIQFKISVPNAELYLILYSDNSSSVITNFFDSFDNSYNYLYHTYDQFVYRSSTIDFAYNFQCVISPGSGNKCAYIVRISP